MITTIQKNQTFGKPDTGWRARLYGVVFEADTVAGRYFDILLLVFIVLSVLTVIVESVPAVRAHDLQAFSVVEWIFTLVFTAEYILRLSCVKRPLRYAFSFFGVIDLLSILPSYLAFFFPDAYALIDVRLLRLLRVFRVLKIPRYFNESQILWNALRASRIKIAIFLGALSIITVILGTLMYLVEGPANGFTSIPTAMYWAIVTLTTTGYGDIHPKTPVGQAITSVAMLLGYGVIALPTGIVGAELVMSTAKYAAAPAAPGCDYCATERSDMDAVFCKHCGTRLQR